MPSHVEDDGNSSKKRKADDNMSGQDKKEIELKLAKQEESIAHTEHVLKVLTSTSKGSKVWDRPEMQNIRELVEVIRSNPQIYHLRVGANTSYR